MNNEDQGQEINISKGNYNEKIQGDFLEGNKFIKGDIVQGNKIVEVNKIVKVNKIIEGNKIVEDDKIIEIKNDKENKISFRIEILGIWLVTGFLLSFLISNVEFIYALVYIYLIELSFIIIGLYIDCLSLYDLKHSLSYWIFYPFIYLIKLIFIIVRFLFTILSNIIEFIVDITVSLVKMTGSIVNITSSLLTIVEFIFNAFKNPFLFIFLIVVILIIFF